MTQHRRRLSPRSPHPVTVWRTGLAASGYSADALMNAIAHATARILPSLPFMIFRLG